MSKARTSSIGLSAAIGPVRIIITWRPTPSARAFLEPAVSPNGTDRGPRPCRALRHEVMRAVVDDLVRAQDQDEAAFAPKPSR